MSNKVQVPDINTKEGMEELEKKLEGIDLGYPKDPYLNAPADMDAAIQRIMEIEMRLEDLARATEIVEITRQFEILEGFRKAADECLVNKITIDRPLPEEPMKITIITDEKEKA
jgi:hypothetical protein